MTDNSDGKWKYGCMYHGTTSRWGFYEPEFYLPDTYDEVIAATSRGQARAKFAELYHLDFTHKMSIRLIPTLQPGDNLLK